MNVDDLRARVTVATLGWLPGVAKALPSGSAVGVHDRLLALTYRAAASIRAADRLRRVLLAEIDRTTDALIVSVLGCLRELDDAGCAFSFDAHDSAGNVTVERFGIDEVPPVSSAVRVFRAAQSLRKLMPRQQFDAMRMLSLQAELTASEASLYSSQLAGASDAEVSELRDVETIVRKKIYALTLQLPSATLNWLDSDENYVASVTWTTWCLPVSFLPTSTDAELLEASQWFEQLSRNIYRPLPIDTAIPAARLIAIERAWSVYEDCGSAYGVLSIWLRCIAATDVSRRCDICYRHLGSGMRRYCSIHTRTAKKRQKARELHVAALYRKSIQVFLQSTPSSLRDAASAVLGPTGIPSMLSVARANEVPDALLLPSATLAATLRELWPVLQPSLQDLVQEHFHRVLSLARQPFDQTPSGDFEERAINSMQRHLAPRWLCLDIFIETWFCSNVVVPWAGTLTVGEGLDVDNPIRSSRSVLPLKLSIDLSFMRLWVLVSKLFDEHAYLNYRSVSALRNQQDGALNRQASLVEIGAILGASAEAVRETLHPVSCTEAVTPRRKRVLPTALRRLEQMFATGTDEESSG